MKNLVDVASNYINTIQGDKRHKFIIDTYNKIKPLPQGYLMKYSDNWCCAFVSFCAFICGFNNFPYECSVNRLVKKSGAKLSNTPHINDLVIYSWNCNNNYNHIGIVSNITNDNIYSIEGNYSKKVGVRIINKNNKYIAGYLHLTNKTSKEIPDNLINDVIRGKYGNGNARKIKLEKMGCDYAEVQKEVNKRLKK